MKPTYGRVSRYGIVAFAQLARPDRAVRPRRAGRGGAAPRGRRPRRARLDVRAGAGPGRAPRPAASATTRPRRRSRASGSGCRGSTSSPAWSPASRRRIREAVAALEAAGAIVDEVSLPHTDYGLATYYIVAPAEASANLARYDGIRFGPRQRRRRRARQLPRDARTGLRRRGEAPDHARDVRPVGRLLRRVLPEGPEGPDADQGATSTRVWAAGFDALVAPTSADGRLPLRGEDGRPRRDVPHRTPAPCRSTWPGCPACRSRAGCRRACRSGSSSSARRGPSSSSSGLARGYEAAHRRTTTGGRSSRRISRPAATRAGPTPVERCRGAGGRRLTVGIAALASLALRAAGAPR